MKIKDTVIKQMNRWGKNKLPFLFVIDFSGENPLLFPLSDIDTHNILYDFQGVSNSHSLKPNSHINEIILQSSPVSYFEYKKQFSRVHQEISYGNTYLLNLTTSTPISINVGLKDIFFLTKAKYKLWLEGQFICFSPETFVKIENNKIFSFPMKGTIDGNISNAREIILSDEKEKAEHYTIVDLIRNDLNLVSKKVKVDSFRYIDQINMQKGPLLQVSSQISGELEDNWYEHIGDIFSKLLPAGSITGAPKERTVKIINEVESNPRGYYTGVAGIFDGVSVNSMVMIRFIEKNNNKYVYKSGGGITFSSDSKKEYEELIQKIYVPTY